MAREFCQTQNTKYVLAVSKTTSSRHSQSIKYVCYWYKEGFSILYLSLNSFTVLERIPEAYISRVLSWTCMALNKCQKKWGFNNSSTQSNANVKMQANCLQITTKYPQVPKLHFLQRETISIVQLMGVTFFFFTTALVTYGNFWARRNTTAKAIPNPSHSLQKRRILNHWARPGIESTSSETTLGP